jgi:hypothetical protein
LYAELVGNPRLSALKFWWDLVTSIDLVPVASFVDYKPYSAPRVCRMRGAGRTARKPMKHRESNPSGPYWLMQSEAGPNPADWQPQGWPNCLKVFLQVGLV